MIRQFLSAIVPVLLAIHAVAAEPRRLEVLFLGDDGNHQPLERYRVLKQALGAQGFNLTFTEDLATITRAKLDSYDALIVYANHEKEKVPQDILPWVREGGALVALHSACGNFHPSKEWFDLVGGRFKSHEGREFSPKTVDPNHPITRDLPVLTCWDETYQHSDLTPDRHLLQVREPSNKDETEPEPWTWIRNEGKGRVFYTASGHDLRCWNEPAYQTLVKRAILWTIGDAKSAALAKFKLPPLETEVPKVANRTHSDIPMMELQKPLSPADSAAHTQVPVGTRLQLFASEPMVVNPIAIDWDPRGRAWVVESFGYPNDVPDQPGSGKDRIKILEDTNGDGTADKMTVFAEGLRHCTTSVFVKDGVVITDGREIVYLGDENGDGRSDVRKVLATGLDIHDTHASTSHFLYGIDNWIYATVGYSGLDVTVAGKQHKFAQSVFRFRPDLSAFEHLQNTTNNTWGLGFTEQGDVTGSTANNNPSWILSIPSAAYADSGIEQPRTPRLDQSGQNMVKMFTNTADVTQVDVIDGYTAASGHQFQTDRVLAKTFDPDNVFICEPTGHIVATGVVSGKDSLMLTTLRGNNAFASSDAWAAPVAARVGPDGALWVADWYNPIIQHNVVFRYYNPARDYDQPHSPYQTGDRKGPGKGNAYETPLRDDKHGRIWRIVPTDSPIRKNTGVDQANPRSLITGLSSPSQLIRLHAQRLIVEMGGQQAVPHLEPLIAAPTSPEGVELPLASVHAIWALEGLGAEPGSAAHRILATALKSSQPLVRRHAMLALGADDAAVLAGLPALIASCESPRELLFILTTIALAPPNEGVSAALWDLISSANPTDPTLQEAARLAMRRQGMALLSTDLSSFDQAEAATWAGGELIATITHLVGKDRPALIAYAPTAPAVLKSHIETLLKAGPIINRNPVDVPQRYHAGRDAYTKACVECHQSDGTGLVGTFPPLAGSEWVKGDTDTLLRILLGGLAGPIEVKGEKYNSVMPGHSHSSDEEIAAIAGFVRHAFGEIRERPISPNQVKALRPEVEQRKFVPWTVQDLKALDP